MLKDLILANRSCRGFNENRLVTKEELTDMVDCARLTASTANIQPLKYFIAWKREQTEKILRCTKWAGALPELGLPRAGNHPTAFIVVLLDKTIDDNMARFQRDCGIAAQTITLRATEMGLAGCMIGSFAAGELKKALDLPETLAPMLVIGLGESVEEAKIVEITPNGSNRYYRDEKDTHYVPKRKLSDVVVCDE